MCGRMEVRTTAHAERWRWSGKLFEMASAPSGWRAFPGAPRRSRQRDVTGRRHAVTEHEPVQIPRPTPERPVIVVGAGMAGLTAAVALHGSGAPVQLPEASDGVGGRIRTDRHPAAFLLDRGFQVLLEAYPYAHRWIDLAALDPRPSMPRPDLDGTTIGAAGGSAAAPRRGAA